MKKIIFLSLFGILPMMIFAQGLFNNGAKIVITSGTTVYVDGGANGNYLNDGTGEIDLDGVLKIEGDFTNNGTTTAFMNVDTDGEVIFAGATQTITSSAADMTNFIDFEKVTINLGSTTNLAAGSAATTNGILDVDGVFTLKTPTDENPTGSLITGTTAGDVTGAGTINVERFFKVDGRWQYVSVPMDNQSSNIFTENTTSGNFNPNLYTYNETYDEGVDGGTIDIPADIQYANYDYPGNGYFFYLAWQQYQADDTDDKTLNVSSGTKTGYITYNEENMNSTFTSTPSDLNHAVNYAPTMSFNSNDGNGDFYDGWNLVGNPYPSALDWDDIYTSLGAGHNINNCAYMWDGDAGNYVYYGAGTSYQFTDGTPQVLNSDANAQYIPAMQSFFVKATAAPTFSIPASARIHRANAMYKNGTDTNSEFSYVKLQASNENNQSDELIVRFFNEATPQIDDSFDAYKMFATTAGLPQIYSLVNNEETETPIAINSLPVWEDDNNTGTDEPKSIPLGFVAKESGTYTIRATELINFDFENIWLVDRTDDQNYIRIDLLTNEEYTCFIEEGEIRDRFYLFFFPEATTTDLFENNTSSNGSDIKIYSNSNQVFLNINSEDNLNGVVTIYDIVGKKVFESKVNSLFNTFTVNSPTGNYIVKYNTKSNVYTQKVFIK